MTDEKMRACGCVYCEMGATELCRGLSATPTDQPATEPDVRLSGAEGLRVLATGDGAEDVVEATIDRMIDAGVKSDGWPGLPRDVLRALARAALATAVVPGMVKSARGPEAVYIQFSDDGSHIRRWGLQPFEGGTQYWSAACTCVEVAGEDPFCTVHGDDA